MPGNAKSGRRPGVVERVKRLAANAEAGLKALTTATDMLGKLGQACTTPENPKGLTEDQLWQWALNTAHKANDAKTVVEVLKYWRDRAEGRAAQSVTHSGLGGRPIKISIVNGSNSVSGDGHDPKPGDSRTRR